MFINLIVTFIQFIVKPIYCNAIYNYCVWFIILVFKHQNTPDLESCDAIIWASQRGYSRDMVIGVKDNKFYDLTYKLSGAHRILTGNEFDSYKYSNSEKYCPLKIISNTSDSYRDEYYSNELMFEYKYDESYTVVITLWCPYNCITTF